MVGIRIDNGGVAVIAVCAAVSVIAWSISSYNKVAVQQPPLPQPKEVVVEKVVGPFEDLRQLLRTCDAEFSHDQEEMCMIKSFDLIETMIRTRFYQPPQQDVCNQQNAIADNNVERLKRVCDETKNGGPS